MSLLRSSMVIVMEWILLLHKFCACGLDCINRKWLDRARQRDEGGWYTPTAIHASKNRAGASVSPWSIGVDPYGKPLHGARNAGSAREGELHVRATTRGDTILWPWSEVCCGNVSHISIVDGSWDASEQAWEGLRSRTGIVKYRHESM